MDAKLLAQALGKVCSGIALLALLLFLPAGTLRYWNGWLLMGILFVPMVAAGFVLLAKAPELLRKRLNVREREPEQRRVIALSGLLFAACFVVAGLNYRFGWTTLPRWAVWAAVAVFLLSYLLYAEVLRENPYLSRTVEVQRDQRVIDTGLYGVVRHPMYSATLLLFLSMPLVLGSVPSFALMLLYLPIIGRRMRGEEDVLARGLAGYRDYQRRVRWKVIPLIW